MREHFNFDRMLTPKIVTVLYILGLGFIVLGALFSMAQGEAMSIVMGLGALIFGPIFLRLSCETVMVIFKIHEHLYEVAQRERR